MEYEDIQTIIDMGAQAHAESEFRCLEYSPDNCFLLAKTIMSSPDALMCYVVEKYGVIVAFVIAGISNGSWFTRDKMSDDLIIYVTPGYRGSRAFYMLVSTYIAWAKTKGARLIFLRNRTGYQPELVGDLYKRLGFEQVGGIYRMEA